MLRSFLLTIIKNGFFTKSFKFSRNQASNSHEKPTRQDPNHGYQITTKTCVYEKRTWTVYANNQYIYRQADWY